MKLQSHDNLLTAFQLLTSADPSKTSRNLKFDSPHKQMDECGHQPMLPAVQLQTDHHTATRFADRVIRHHQGPKSPKYASLETREKSFYDKYRPWPPGLNQKPADLAEAGFYYYGVGDQVLCFYCDGGMHKWDPSDNAWTEHAKWFPGCGYLLLKKGSAFVASVQQNHRQYQEPTTTEEGPIDVPCSTGSSGDDEHTSLESYSSHSRADEPIEPSTGNSLETRLGSMTLNGEQASSSNSKSKKPNRELSTEQILEENRKLKEDRLCKICLDKDKEIIFVPCGHYVACLDCGLGFEKCPVCRAKIISIVKTYMT